MTSRPATFSRVKQRPTSGDQNPAEFPVTSLAADSDGSGSGQNEAARPPEPVPKPLQALLRPVDGSSLAVFRMAIGLAVAWYAAKHLTSGAVGYAYIEPVFHFTYYGFEWVRPLPGAGMYIVFAVMAAAGVCFACGLFYRVSALLLFLTFTYVFLCERSRYNNHYYLISLLSFLAMFIPLHRCWSVDALRSAQVANNQLPAWAFWLLRFQLGIVYFYGGLAKINADWLRGQPMRMWLAEQIDYPLIGGFFTHEWMVQIFVWGGLLIDLLAVPLLLWRHTRPYMFSVLVLFHLLNATLFNIGVFPWLMIVATTIFFPPDWPRRVVRSSQPTNMPAGESAPVSWNWRLQLGTTLLTAYVLLQLLIPFRRFLYEGPTSWTEQGHFFSWRMMLRDKHGGVRFYATNPETGREGIADIRPYINEVQLGKMLRSPDHVLQMAHFLADEFQRQGLGETEIRVKALISLNGRKPQLLVDPDVDLARQPRSLWGYDWIMPLKEPLRHDAWDVPMWRWESELGM